MAFVLLLAAASGSMAASIDTETTDTSSTSDITSGYNQTYNGTTTSTLQVAVSSTNPEVTVYQGDTANGTTLLTLTDAEMELVNSVNSTYYYRYNVSDDGSDYEGLSANPGETVNVTAQVVDNASLDEANQTMTNVTWQFANGESTEFVRVAGTNTKVVNASSGLFGVSALSLPDFASASLSSLSTGFGLWGSTSSDSSTTTTSMFNGSAQASETLNPTTNTTEAVVDFESSKADDAAANALDADSEGGLVMFASAQIGDTWVPVVASSSDLPSYMNDSATYVVLNEGGATVHNLNETTTSKADLTLTLNEQLNGDAYKSTLKTAGVSGWFSLFKKTSLNWDLNGNPDWANAASA